MNDVFGNENYTIKSNYVNTKVIKWIKELAISKVVFELSTKRYIVIDDFSINYTTSKDKFQVEMKYHYSDTYNNNIQRK
ncbi:hypothetical protein EZS27_031229 [termite gut metagenome]|uniref:Uncharacterized protein n=1 Tax=termite gut metagenome TaxID=433724 RepID=A0A5J4QDY7_9ZZZZ